LNACATVEEPKLPSKQDLESRMKILKKERKTYMRLLDKAASSEEARDISSGLNEVQTEYEKTQEMMNDVRDREEGFESTKKRTIVYGPVGWVLVGSRVILDKLYIIYPWTWKTF
jgi:vesicle coat complex subunit